MQRRVNRIQNKSHVISADLLGYLLNNDNVQRATISNLREQDICRLPLLFDVALLDTGEEILTDCGLRAGEIVQIIEIARSDFGQLVHGKWKRHLTSRMEGGLGDSDSEIESNSESPIEMLSRKHLENMMRRALQ